MSEDEIILRYMLWGFDETPYRVLANKMQVIRKPSHCAICFEDIPVGSRVRAQREVYNGKVMTFRMCPKCCNAVVQDWREGDCLHMEERINIGMGRSGAYPPIATQDMENERTVRSLAAMLGWENTPPRETLERSLSALRSRWQEAEAARQDAQADLENALARERKLKAELSSLRSQVEILKEYAQHRNCAKLVAHYSEDGQIIVKWPGEADCTCGLSAALGRDSR